MSYLTVVRWAGDDVFTFYCQWNPNVTILFIANIKEDTNSTFVLYTDSLLLHNF